MCSMSPDVDIKRAIFVFVNELNGCRIQIVISPKHCVVTFADRLNLVDLGPIFISGAHMPFESDRFCIDPL